MALATDTDRPNSICNRCIIYDFGCVFVLSLVFFC